MNAPPADAPLPNLNEALLLLRHAGLPMPAGAPGSPAFMQSIVDGLVQLSSRDGLTGLANRRQFDIALASEMDRVARSGEPALLLGLDVDHFKRFNDTHGHAAGDEVLRAVAKSLQETVRPMDLAARVGGEEFAVILPNCPPAFGETVAERIRRRIENTPVTVAPGKVLSVTVSVGGAYAHQWVRSTATLWSGRADAQLYRAKALGRNIVCLEPTQSTEVTAEERSLLFGISQFQDIE